ncbi:hypothetical protein UFOVP351_46 [uncultured Caudovirales phage]|uniref:Uncharacterized protein n=1 Tax=uncultured Caudovirales phage TaxID=2100421 RepID=A0A6J5LY53_9CAUD|nr:hypothetical protein UFOVP351_46 [uncultured Caudovirales phage]
MSFSNFLENKVLGHVFGATPYTAPATLYVGLFTSNPGETGSGTEVSGGSYARQTIAFTVTGSQASNTAAVEFPTATASWGTITYAAIYDAVSGGNLLAYGALTTSKTIDNGDVFRIPAGDFDINLD